VAQYEIRNEGVTQLFIRLQLCFSQEHSLSG